MPTYVSTSNVFFVLILYGINLNLMRNYSSVILSVFYKNGDQTNMAKLWRFLVDYEASKRAQIWIISNAKKRTASCKYLFENTFNYSNITRSKFYKILMQCVGDWLDRWQLLYLFYRMFLILTLCFWYSLLIYISVVSGGFQYT
jgi:hypothetical protein